MKNPRLILLIILIMTTVALVIDLPSGIPIKANLGPIKIDRITKSAHLNISWLKINRPITTHLGLDLLGGTQLVLEADMKGVIAGDRDQALESVREVMDRRVNFFGVSEPVVQTAKVGDSYRVIVELPGISDIDQAVVILGQTAQLEFREMQDSQSTASAMFPMLNNTKTTGVTGKDLKEAQVAFDPTTGEPIVSFELTKEGTKKFGDLTTRLVGKPLAIFLDEFPISAPIVKTPITEGRGSITGSFTRDAAKRLALQLSAGALPTPVKIIEQKNIGPTLGSQSITNSIRAGIIGLVLVGSFMALYYGRLGLIADIALIIYGLVTYAIFRLIPVTLTLPGIAGFILSVGMAVDSNILIFERFKEEMRAGKPRSMAMELGFGRAWDSIRDANITTILTALILLNPLNWNFIPASGAVRGFAITLLIGVLMSLFTGIVVTRNIIRGFYD